MKMIRWGLQWGKTLSCRRDKKIDNTQFLLGFN